MEAETGAMMNGKWSDGTARQPTMSPQEMEASVATILDKLRLPNPNDPNENLCNAAASYLQIMLVGEIRKIQKNPWAPAPTSLEVDSEVIATALVASIRKMVVADFRKNGPNGQELQNEEPHDLFTEMTSHSDQVITQLAQAIVENPTNFNARAWYKSTAPDLSGIQRS